MNIVFKIKHYLLPYFQIVPLYSVNSKTKVNYWIKGYSNNLKTKKWKISESGIPLGLYTKNLKLELPKRVHICGLNEYCFANIELDLSYKNKAVLDFIEKTISTSTNKKYGFEYSFWKTYINPFEESYYVHGMGQGQLLSLFSIYHSDKKSYKDLLIKISNSYLVDFEDTDGFVRTVDGVIFEEYPKHQDTDPAVLNGWIYSIIGLHDYLATIRSEDDKYYSLKLKLFNNSIENLVGSLRKYNLWYWSTYCQPNSILNICSIHYQVQHIVLTEALFIITKNNNFTKFNKKLKTQYYNPIFRILALISKIFISNPLKYRRLYKRI